MPDAARFALRSLALVLAGAVFANGCRAQDADLVAAAKDRSGRLLGIPL